MMQKKAVKFLSIWPKNNAVPYHTREYQLLDTSEKFTKGTGKIQAPVDDKWDSETDTEEKEKVANS